MGGNNKDSRRKGEGKEWGSKLMADEEVGDVSMALLWSDQGLNSAVGLCYCVSCEGVVQLNLKSLSNQKKITVCILNCTQKEKELCVKCQPRFSLAT